MKQVLMYAVFLPLFAILFTACSKPESTSSVPEMNETSQVNTTNQTAVNVESTGDVDQDFEVIDKQIESLNTEADFPSFDEDSF